MAPTTVDTKHNNKQGNVMTIMIVIVEKWIETITCEYLFPKWMLGLVNWGLLYGLDNTYNFKYYKFIYFGLVEKRRVAISKV